MPHYRFVLFTGLALLLASASLRSQGLRPSWKDLGTQMLLSGKHDSARFYLEKWLEADPGDESSWYNLACIRALGGDREEALTAWENAVTAGWSDAGHPLRDADLESIRSDARFTAALERVHTAQKSKGPAGFVRHHLETRTVGTYVVLLPEDYEKNPQRRYPLCIILHGSGSTELGHGRLADAIGREDVIYIAPRALHAHTTSHQLSGELGYTVRPPDAIDSLEPLHSLPPQMYAAWIMQCADDARERYRINEEPALILGHSQGAAYSWITAVLYPEKVRGIFAYAGYFPEEYSTASQLATVRDNGLSVTLAHGTVDNVVEPNESRRLDSLLDTSKIEHSLSMHEETGHGISEAVRREMRLWIDRETGRVQRDSE